MLVKTLFDEVNDLFGGEYVFQFDCPPGSVMIKGDETRLEQVFHNLVGNAVKYSPDGGTISARVEYDDAWVHIAVADQGIGIPEDARGRLFQKYFRSSNAGTSGLGIGLFVAKEILALHGGEITVVGKENEGSTLASR